MFTIKNSIRILVIGGVAAGFAQYVFHSAGRARAASVPLQALPSEARLRQVNQNCAYCQNLSPGGVSSPAINALLRANRAIQASPLAQVRKPMAPLSARNNVAPLTGAAVGMPRQLPTLNTDLVGAHILPTSSWFNDKNFSLADVDPSFNVNCKVYPTNPPDIRCTTTQSGGSVFQAMTFDSMINSPTFQMMAMLAQGFAMSKTTSDIPSDGPPTSSFGKFLTHVSD